MTCKSKNESNEIITDMEIQIAFVTQYFNQSEFKESTPIKSVINKDLYFTLKEGASNNFVYKLSQNFVTIQDNIFSDLFPAKEYTYHDFRFIHFQPGTHSTEKLLPLLQVIFGLDEQTLSFRRVKQTLPEVFSIIGGLLGIIFTVCGIFMQAINGQLFEIELLNSNLITSDSEKPSIVENLREKTTLLKHLRRKIGRTISCRQE